MPVHNTLDLSHVTIKMLRGMDAFLKLMLSNNSMSNEAMSKAQEYLRHLVQWRTQELSKVQDIVLRGACLLVGVGATNWQLADTSRFSTQSCTEMFLGLMLAAC